MEEIQDASREERSMPRCISCLKRRVGGKGTRAAKKPENAYDTHLLVYDKQMLINEHLPSNNYHRQHVGHLSFELIAHHWWILHRILNCAFSIFANGKSALLPDKVAFSYLERVCWKKMAIFAKECGSTNVISNYLMSFTFWEFAWF